MRLESARPRLGRLLVLDESIDHRVEAELVSRGLDATTVHRLGLKGSHDRDLAAFLVEHHPGSVIVTLDDQFPIHAGETMFTKGATAAIVNPTRPPDYASEKAAPAWARQVVHRWAHAMQEQAVGTARRYGLVHQAWAVRRRSHRVRYLTRQSLDREIPHVARDAMNRALAAIDPIDRSWPDGLPRWIASDVRGYLRQRGELPPSTRSRG